MLKKRNDVEYTEANKDIKRSLANDKRKYIDDPAIETETAASGHNMKKIYYTARKNVVKV